MRFVHRLLYRQTEELVKVLEKAGVPNERSAGMLVIAKIEDRRIAKLGLDAFRDDLLVDDITKVYDKEEIQNARWLTVYPTWQQYNTREPESSFRYPCPACRANGEQVGDVVLSTKLTRLKRPFMKPHDLYELFVTADAKEILEKSPFSLRYRRVCYSRVGNLAPNLFQLVLENLPPAVVDPAANYKKKGLCLQCGTEYGIRRQEATLTMRADALKNVPGGIYKTAEYFGEHALGQLFVASGDFYRYLQETKLDTGLRIEDIVQLV